MPLYRVLKNNDLMAKIESYLTIGPILSLRESFKQSTLFTIDKSENFKWKERYERFFGQLVGAHKCIEQKFKDTYEQTVSGIKKGLIDFSSLNEPLKDDPFVALIAIKKHFSYVSDISIKLKLDKPFMLQAVTIDKSLYQFRDEKFYDDRELAMAFITAFPKDYQLLPFLFKTDDEFINVVKTKLGLDKKYPNKIFSHVEEFDNYKEPPRLRRTYAMSNEHVPKIDYSKIRFR